MIEKIHELDWQKPWLVPLLAQATAVLGAPDWRAALNQLAQSSGLLNHRGLPVHFVSQAALPEGVAYEAFISDIGAVPTRNNLHDFFNAMMWLRFPRIKVELNRLQAAEIMRVSTHAESSGARGRLRDGATIFDENAALFITADFELADLLRRHQWHALFVEKRLRFLNNVDVILFGHALIEKLAAPYKAITAHAWVILVEPGFFAIPPDEQRGWIDSAVAQGISEGLSTADFTPLPVLGVPGWWQDQHAEFYADVIVFRPKRLSFTR
jgi:hypothetical protein